MLKLILDIEDYGSAENVPKMDGKVLLCFIKPKPKK
jgi:translation initiation factor IF-3